MATKTATSTQIDLNDTSGKWTDDEISAMKEHAKELKTAKKRAGKDAAAEGEADVLAKIKEMPGPDKAIAAKIHEIVKANAPELASRTWYGMPPTPGTARSCASSRRRRSLTAATRPSGSRTRPRSTTATCGRRPMPWRS